MIERSIQLRDSIQSFCKSEPKLNKQLSYREWEELEKVLSLLEPFAETTKHIEGFKYPTLTIVIPLYNQLLNLVEDWKNKNYKSLITRQGASNAYDKLYKYYERTTPIYLVATVLDPRMKLQYFIDHGWKEASEEFGFVNLIDTKIRPA